MPYAATVSICSQGCNRPCFWTTMTWRCHVTQHHHPAGGEWRTAGNKEQQGKMNTREWEWWTVGNGNDEWQGMGMMNTGTMNMGMKNGGNEQQGQQTQGQQMAGTTNGRDSEWLGRCNDPTLATNARWWAVFSFLICFLFFHSLSNTPPLRPPARRVWLLNSFIYYIIEFI